MFWLWDDSKYIFISCFYFTILTHPSFLASSPPPLIPEVFEGVLEPTISLSPLFAAEDQMYYFLLFACLMTG